MAFARASTGESGEPGTPASASLASTRRTRLAIVGSALVLFAVTRLTLSFDDIANPDIAGILYEADLLLRGGLPYVDTVEFKQPGTFLLFAALFGVFGRSLVVVQIAYALWLLLGAAAVAWAARTLYDRDGARPLASPIAAALWLLSAPQFDYNYSGWMTVPLAGAFAALLAAVHGSRRRGHVLAGFLAATACLFKAQAGVLVGVFPFVWLWARRRGLPGARPSAIAAWLGGSALAFVPLLLLYAPGGHLGALWSTKLGLGEAAAYTTDVWDISAFALAGGVAGQHGRVFQLGTTLAVLALGVAWSRRHEDAPPIGPAIALWVSGIVAGAMGGPRYYAHYLVQYLPGLALVGAYPALWAWLTSGETAPGVAGVLRWIGRVSVGAALAWQLAEIPRGKGHRYDNLPQYIEGYTAPQAIGEFIGRSSAPDDTVFVWGLTAWPVYYWAQRHAPTPVFKAMGTLTTYNTNTAFSPGTQIHFRPGPAADELIRAFEQRPPAFFVHANPWPGMGCRFDPLLEFEALGQRLGRDYVGVFAWGGLRLFEHRAHARARGLAVAEPAP